ncbi:MAG: VanZ family protein [Desulfuromonadales bacterium]
MAAITNLKTRNPSTFEFVLRLLAPLAWAATILWLSLTSSPPQIPGVLGWDKLLHGSAYAVLTLLIAQFLFCLPLHPGKACRVALLAALCLGALMEVAQLLAHTGRTAEWWDLFADAVGASLACVLLRQVQRLVSLPHEPVDKNHG